MCLKTLRTALVPYINVLSNEADSTTLMIQSAGPRAASTMSKNCGVYHGQVLKEVPTHLGADTLQSSNRDQFLKL